eukprot:gene25051-biopygen10484
MAGLNANGMDSVQRQQLRVSLLSLSPHLRHGGAAQRGGGAARGAGASSLTAPLCLSPPLPRGAPPGLPEKNINVKVCFYKCNAVPQCCRSRHGSPVMKPMARPCSKMQFTCSIPCSRHARAMPAPAVTPASTAPLPSWRWAQQPQAQDIHVPKLRISRTPLRARLRATRQRRLAPPSQPPQHPKQRTQHPANGYKETTDFRKSLEVGEGGPPGGTADITVTSCGRP